MDVQLVYTTTNKMEENSDEDRSINDHVSAEIRKEEVAVASESSLPKESELSPTNDDSGVGGINTNTN
jgi:hypothetical protein